MPWHVKLFTAYRKHEPTHTTDGKNVWTRHTRQTRRFAVALCHAIVFLYRVYFSYHI